MSAESQKARDFVRHLLDNPALRNRTSLQKEEQIIAFLDVNEAQLYPTLSSGQFFPGKRWQEIRSLLIGELLKITDESFQAYLRRFVLEQLDLGFTAFLGVRKPPQEEMKTNLLKLDAQVAHKAAGRRALTGSFNALAYQLSEKYIEKIYSSRNYIRFELEKVQRLRMSKEEVKNLIKASLLIGPAAYLLSADGPSMHQMKTWGTIERRAALTIIDALLKRLPNFPRDVIKSGVESNISFLEHSDILTTSRLTTLFSHLAYDYKPDMFIDRGASTPEKSWFSIARKNYRYFGYDIKMVDELYKIAAENGW